MTVSGLDVISFAIKADLDISPLIAHLRMHPYFPKLGDCLQSAPGPCYPREL